MNEPNLDRLHELSWRRKLTQAEVAELQKQLAANPHARVAWQTDAALNQLLEQLPDAPPVASNFTALVLQAVARDAAAAERAQARGWLDAWRGWRWLPRAGVAGLVIGFAVVGYDRHQVHARAALARNMAEMAEVVSASGPDFVADLEPIRRLSDGQQKADPELLALMTFK